jgi:hypothetical protein
LGLLHECVYIPIDSRHPQVVQGAPEGSYLAFLIMMLLMLPPLRPGPRGASLITCLLITCCQALDCNTPKQCYEVHTHEMHAHEMHVREVHA